MILYICVLLCLVDGTFGETTHLDVENNWNGGFHGTFYIAATTHDLNGWTAHVTCSNPLSKFETWNANVVSNTNGKTVIRSGDYIPQGQSNSYAFNGFFSGSAPSCNIAIGEGNNHATQAPQQTTAASHHVTNAPAVTHAPSHSGGRGAPMKYDYSEALKLSMLFFYAQRSGRISGTFNPIPWRGDSAVNDGDAGHDLSGGWYDAGDHVKFNFPMTQAVHALLMGFEKFMDAYDAAGKTNEMYDMMKWPLDYFIKCWIPSQQIYYFQVGDGHADHAYWGPPERMTMYRPAYKLDSSHPGSDIAGGTVACLASAARIWKNKDAAYSAKLLAAAKSLYDFAKAHPGAYTATSTAAKDFYGSDEYKDEMCTAAAELHKTTQESRYLNDAKGYYSADVPWSYNWGDKTVACQLLLFEITKEAKYRQNVEAFITSWLPGHGVPYTPCGLVFRNEWGANRYAGNGAFIAVMAAADGIGGDAYLNWAMTQINYLLGDNNYHMSYEIGFGNNYPHHPHHRAASSAHQDLKGGLVGGPGQNDDYVDNQEDYVKNEVACDYNAGFHSAVAGLYHFYVNNKLPPAPHSKC